MRGLPAAVIALVLTLSAWPADLAAQEDTSCATCHSRLAGRLQEPLVLWRQGVHRLSGIGCAGCHGGDPDNMDRAMTSAAGFTGKPGREQGIKLCSMCHNGTMADDPLRIDYGALYRSGAHGGMRTTGEAPTCTTCHGSHGIRSAADPTSPIHLRNISRLCTGCHRADGEGRPQSAGTGSRTGDAHSRSLEEAGNLRAPTCATCHGSHSTSLLSGPAAQRLCGRCHQAERSLLLAGKHGDALRSSGEPGCTDCHFPHAIEPVPVDGLIDRFSILCLECHPAGSRPAGDGVIIAGELQWVLTELEAMESHAADLAQQGIDVTALDGLTSEARGWVGRARRASHRADAAAVLETTGMARVKIIAARRKGQDGRLELKIRRAILTFVSLLAMASFLLLGVRLRRIEREQKRKNLMRQNDKRSNGEDP